MMIFITQIKVTDYPNRVTVVSLTGTLILCLNNFDVDKLNEKILKILSVKCKISHM